MDLDQHQRGKESVIMCVIVGYVPNSGYMLRFTQEHACLHISSKPVDMPEDSPQTPHITGPSSDEREEGRGRGAYADGMGLSHGCRVGNYKSWKEEGK